MSVDKNICPFLTLSKHVRFPSRSDLTSPSGDRYSVFIDRSSHVMSSWFSWCRRTCSILYFSGLWLRFFNSWENTRTGDAAYRWMGADRKEKVQVRSSHYRLWWLGNSFACVFLRRLAKERKNIVRLTSHDCEVEGSGSCRYLRGDYFLKFSSVYFLSLFSRRLLADRKHPLSIVFLFVESVWVRVCLCLNFKRRSYASSHNLALASVSEGFFNIHLKEME